MLIRNVSEINEIDLGNEHILWSLVVVKEWRPKRFDFITKF